MTWRDWVRMAGIFWLVFITAPSLVLVALASHQPETPKYKCPHGFWNSDDCPECCL